MTQDDTGTSSSYIEMQKAGKLQQLCTLQWYILHGQKMPQMSMALLVVHAELCFWLFLVLVVRLVVCLSFRRHTMVDQSNQRH